MLKYEVEITTMERYICKYFEMRHKLEPGEELTNEAYLVGL